MFETNNV